MLGDVLHRIVKVGARFLGLESKLAVLERLEEEMRVLSVSSAAQEEETSMDSKDFMEALKRICGPEFALHEEEIRMLCHLFGNGGSLAIHRRRFVDAAKEFHGLNDEQLFKNRIKSLFSQAVRNGVDIKFEFSKFDPKNKGFMSVTSFSLVFQQLGFGLSDNEISLIASAYKSNESENASTVNYQLLLNEVFFPKTKKEQKEGPGIDVVQKVNDFIRELSSAQFDAVRELWIMFEGKDEKMHGQIALSDLDAIFESLGLKLTTLDKRRILVRFQGDENDMVLYRELLLGLSGKEKIKPSHIPLDRLSETESESVIDHIATVKLAVDYRDVFEQFDFELEGFVSRKDFIRCMKWLQFFKATDEDASRRSIAERLANQIEEKNDRNRIEYRKLVLLIEERKRRTKAAEALKLRRSNVELDRIMEAFEKSRWNLGISGIEIRDCFTELTDSGRIKLNDFVKSLKRLGIEGSVDRFQGALENFENEDGLVDFELFLKISKLSESMNDKKSFAPQSDRFIFLRTLRQYLKEDIQNSSADKFEAVQSLFDELDFAGDGAIQVEDLVEAAAMLDLDMDHTEAKRCIDFPFLFFSRTSESGQRYTELEPRSPFELADEASAASRQFFELTFETFCILLGMGVVHSERHSSTWRALFQRVEETHASSEEVIIAIKDHVQNNMEGDNLIGLINAFHAKDFGMGNFVSEQDAREILKDYLGMHLQEDEFHRLFRRLGLLKNDENIRSTGSAEFKFREFMLKLDPDAFERFVSQEEEAAMHMILASEEESIEALIVDLKAMGGNNNRDEIAEHVWGFCNKVHSSDALSISTVRNLLRRFEPKNDGHVDIQRFSDFVYLEMTPSEKEKIAKKLSDNDVLEKLQGFDVNFDGVLPRETLRLILTEEMFLEDLFSKICDRFEILRGRWSGVDYREMLRYFKIFGKETKGKLEERVDLGAMIRMSDASKRIWRFLWRNPHEKGGKSRPMSFFQWKMKKDVFEPALQIMEKLDGDLSNYEGFWREVGTALAATELFLKAVSPNAKMGTLMDAFLSWSKRGKAFTKLTEDGFEISFRYEFNDPKNPDNKRFIAKCKTKWSECVREVEQKMLIERIQSQEYNVRKELFELGFVALQNILKDREELEAERKSSEKLELERLRKKEHEQFVKRKNQLKLKLPREEEIADLAMDSVLAQLVRISHANYAHATTIKDLEKSKKALLKAGHIVKANFEDGIGDIDMELFKKYQSFQERMKTSFEAARRQGADHHFSIWDTLKGATIQAKSLLRFIEKPETSDAATTEEDRRLLWLDVGRALKSIESKALLASFLEWSEGFRTRSECISAWTKLSPRSLNEGKEQDWKWMHLCSILGKLLSKRSLVISKAFDVCLKRSFPDLKRKKKEEKKAIFSQFLKCCPANLFRSVLAIAGVNLRLHEERRLMECYPGLLEEREPVDDHVSMASIIQVCEGRSQKANPDSKTQQDGILKEWSQSLKAIGELEDGRAYVLSIEDRVRNALVLAGAPDEITIDWKRRRANLQQGLVFLSYMSRGRRSLHERAQQELRKRKPPRRPSIQCEKATENALHLCYSQNLEEETQVLYFRLELSRRRKLEGIFFDPPSRNSSTPPSGKLLANNLRPNTEYVCNLTAFNKVGQSRAAKAQFCTVPEPPGRPKRIKTHWEGKEGIAFISWGEGFAAVTTPAAIIPKPLHVENLQLPGTVLEKPIASSCFELCLVVGAKLLVLYQGQSESCSVQGLQSGMTYAFVVRCLNQSGVSSECSEECVFTPIKNPGCPVISNLDEILQVSWPSFPPSLFMLEEQDDAIEYEVKVRQIENGEESVQLVNECKIVLERLIPNCMYGIQVRAKSFSLDLKSPWSKQGLFATPPRIPWQPVIVDVFSNRVILRWYLPAGGADRIILQHKHVSSDRETWKESYKGRSCLIMIPHLISGAAYRFRCIATNEKETVKSRPSLPAQCVTLSAEEEATTKMVTPYNAKDVFVIPCGHRDVVVGDLIIFSEKGNLPCWRTIAGRITSKLARKGIFWIEIVWCTTSLEASEHKYISGARIQRKMGEIFKHEAKLGVYRAPWTEEEGRWSRQQEENAPS